jgi:ribosomal protein S18 acetylase RimI-like enzyme
MSAVVMAEVQKETNKKDKPKVHLDNLSKKDLPAVAQIHLAAFPESGLTMLGLEAVRRYYEWQLTGPHDVTALGAFVDGELAGFCFCGIFRGATSGFLSHNKSYLTWRVLTHPWLFANPIIRDRINISTHLLSGFSRTKKKETKKPQDRMKPFGILSIAVHPNRQGLGIGKLLMLESETIARRQNFREMDLTVHPENHQAVGFYESLAWKKCEQEGVWKGFMKKTL